MLYPELTSIQAEQARYRPATVVPSQSSAIADIEQTKTQLQTVLAKLPAAKCDATGAAGFVNQVMQLAQRFSKLSFDHDLESDTWSSIVLANGSSQERCAQLREALSGDLAKALASDLDRFTKETAQKSVELQQQADLAKQVVDLLEARKAEVKKKLSELENQEKAKQSLPYVIGLIGLLSILVLLVVRIFPPELQTEWINSGQVIQFVTVMVLLSVIMALGLAGIITENTLGTLLGGIAGYVLSQGVGRAAAREVTRGVLASRDRPTERRGSDRDEGPSGGRAAVETPVGN